LKAKLNTCTAEPVNLPFVSTSECRERNDIPADLASCYNERERDDILTFSHVAKQLEIKHINVFILVFKI